MGVSHIEKLEGGLAAAKDNVIELEKTVAFKNRLIKHLNEAISEAGADLKKAMKRIAELEKSVVLKQGLIDGELRAYCDEFFTGKAGK